MYGRLISEPNETVFLDNVRWCSSFICKLRGLMFRRALEPDEGLLLVEQFESRTATAIHMLFMRFAIAVIWLDFQLCHCGQNVCTCVGAGLRT